MMRAGETSSRILIDSDRIISIDDEMWYYLTIFASFVIGCAVGAMIVWRSESVAAFERLTRVPRGASKASRDATRAELLAELKEQSRVMELRRDAMTGGGGMPPDIPQIAEDYKTSEGLMNVARAWIEEEA
jgi:hypothetical protein